MPATLNARVLFSNSAPAEDVRIRVFDKDQPGKVDDDLTTREGRSNGSGSFSVEYELSRYLDYFSQTISVPRNPPWDWTLVNKVVRVPDPLDIPLPYLQFRYSINGEPHTHTAALNPLQSEFRLPENPPLSFLPSEHGFNFTNGWGGIALPISVPGIPDLPLIPNEFGLCGGMSAAAYDFLLAGRQIPQTSTKPAQGSPLFQYLYRRQIDTFGALGRFIAKFAEWMVIPDGTILGTEKRTHDEFEKVQAKLDDGNAVLLGLVYTKASDTAELWTNHQVLAYGYRQVSNSAFEINIYDPNDRNADDVRIRAERVQVGRTFRIGPTRRLVPVFGLRCEQLGPGDESKPVHGFFDMDYTPVVPPSGL